MTRENSIFLLWILLSAMYCGTSAVGDLTVASWAAIAAQSRDSYFLFLASETFFSINTCLSGCASSLTTFLATAIAALEPEFGGFYDTVSSPRYCVLLTYCQMMSNFTTLKAQGLAEEAVLNSAYKAINNRYYRTKINALCIQLAKVIRLVSAKDDLSGCQFYNSDGVRINNFKTIFYFTVYPYAEYTKSSMLGVYTK